MHPLFGPPGTDACGDCQARNCLCDECKVTKTQRLNSAVTISPNTIDQRFPALSEKTGESLQIREPPDVQRYTRKPFVPDEWYQLEYPTCTVGVAWITRREVEYFLIAQRPMRTGFPAGKASLVAVQSRRDGEPVADRSVV